MKYVLLAILVAAAATLYVVISKGAKRSFTEDWFAATFWATVGAGLLAAFFLFA
ncbi:hypothetical protein [Bradyrhizobium sp. C9]|uniref:hypothetical protein n=1 Tax=Bradyrhizobium sp. C9 TaxID=142585 RepID=UPI001303F88C|nr:hypothetical protein [Bradyrhizobium sp. C9]